MQKLFYVFAFSIIALFAFTPIVFAVDQRGNTYTEGSFIMMGTEPSAEDMLFEAMFSELVLKINNFGEVSGVGNTTVNQQEYSGALLSGTANINMQGQYDPTDNTVSGEFEVNHTGNTVDENEAPLLSFYSDWTMTFSGTFSGGQSGENGDLIITYTGTKTSNNNIENSNSFKDTYEESKSWTNKVRFSDYSIPVGVTQSESLDSTEVENVESEIVTQIKLEKAVGDILVSDPDERASVLTMTGRTILAMTGRYDRRDQPWRSWKQPDNGMTLKPNSKLKTDIGMGKVQLKDGTIFILGRGSQALVTKTGGVKMEKGVGYFIIPKTGERREVWAVNGRVGVQGTEFSITETGDYSEVKLTEGAVVITLNDDSKQVELSVGESVKFDSENFQGVESFNATEEMTNWENENSMISDILTSEIDDGNETLVGIIAVVVLVGVTAGVGIVIRSRRNKDHA